MQITNFVKTKVFAIIVLYNPDLIKLRMLVDSVKRQVDSIVLVDNTNDVVSKNIENEVKTLHCDNVIYLPLHGNFGIAHAQNVGIKYSKKSFASHFLLLDQDSLLPEKMIENLLHYEKKIIDDGIKVAAIGPSFRDEKTGKVTGAIRVYPFFQKILSNANLPIATDYLIASGTLINVKSLDVIGMMREDLFIDLVDIEWCARARKSGFKCYVAPDVIMNHSIGNEAKKYFGKNVITHSDFRHYFIVRNTIHLILKRKLTTNHLLFLALRLPLFIIIHIFTSPSKKEKIGLFFMAIKDGIRGKMGKGILNS
ncbi:glycosyltransferase family 2 protein [Citrobacter sedlakii]|uniref:glycosyltransferase family 2 protein n=1 Tax=Citrobacter sedlakii TaxID=67826 RepID=UPI0022B38903|nr:glycosyltransferase family 2 protein [Citrobacter sedlakii]MCZ4673873.1 glycosyltransferase family 2 protein [Citrobacter sedlakii]MDR5003929.1 glycosyltransferase family 2 protein [Citrobacter sedlakii]